MKDYENFDSPKGGSKLPMMVLPLATALVSVAVGLAVGWSLRYMTTPETIVQVPRDYTFDELEAVCKPLIRETAEELDVAQERVKNLESLVTEKAGQVAELEEEMDRRAERGTAKFRELRRELEAAQAQLATLEEQLDIAKNEKEQIMVELEQTQDRLEHQIVLTEEAEAEVVDQRWLTFVRDVQFEICDRGNRKKLGTCRESITASLADTWRDRWQGCVATGQAQPVIKERENKKEELPEFAAWINQEERTTKDWYIVWCDPTLPEATDLMDFDRELRELDDLGLDENGDDILDLDEVLSSAPPPKDELDDLDDEFWDEFAEDDL